MMIMMIIIQIESKNIHLYISLHPNDKKTNPNFTPMKRTQVQLIHHEDFPQTRTRPKAPIVYKVDESNSEQQQEQQEMVPQNSQNRNFIQPQIETVVSRKEVKDEQGQPYYLYLAKYRQKSYFRAEWMLQEELADKGYYLDTQKRKSLHSRMAKTQKLKLGQEHHFNPNYLIPDRILTSTDLFAAIQPKKANQIKGTWQQSMQLVCLKLFNFEKNSYPYGTLLLKEIVSAENSSHEVTLPTILNRLYFGLYENYQVAWEEIGRAIRQFIKNYEEQGGDYLQVGYTLRQAAQFLYIQWFMLSLERYENIKQERPTSNGNGPTNGKLHIPQLAHIKEKFKLEADFCKQNVFMTTKVAQKPKNPIELERLNPRKLSFEWIEHLRKSPFKYENLQKQDMIALDLNQEIDQFYLVKWKELSYAESTWERESMFKHPEKVEEFMAINKMPNKDTRQGLERNYNMHCEIMKFYDQNRAHSRGRPKKVFGVEHLQQKLYLVKGPSEHQKVKVYGGKDVITFKDYRLLKDFQNEALNWFISNWHQNRNTLLADQMGLGKTIQVLAFLYHLHVHEKVLGPFLVLAPLTTLQQWRRQIEAWTNFNCLLYYDQGQQEGRQVCQQHEFYCTYTRRNGEMVKSSIPKFNILLTNYESFTRDYSVLRKFAFQHIVVDQAHKIKNPKSILAVNLRELPCKRITLMTGTPLQNNTKQLWALLNYIDPIRFADEDSFCDEFGKLNTEAEVGRLKKILRPYLLRRVKEDVQKLIPRLSEVIIDVEMTKQQKYIYKGLLQRNKNQIIKGLSTANLNNLTIQLRKCSNHPFLVSPELEQQHLKDAKSDKQIIEAFQSCSGKLILLCKLLAKFRQQGKKTLIFSQFVTMLELLQEHLERVGYNCELLHGSITAGNRHRAIHRFSEQGSQSQVFLISTKAGGVGINLTAATEIVIYDSDWNPQNDIQATARAHRIGQKNQVTVYRLITSNTYQAEMFKTSSKKLGIDKAVFSGNFFKQSNGDEGQQRMSKEQVEMLLRKGVLGFIENKTDEDQYFKQDIDQIIEKSGHRIEYAFGQNKNYTYSKSTFVGEYSSSQLDIRDQNFWQVALKDLKSPIQQLSNKAKNLSKFSTPKDQQALMLQTINLVSELVKSKVTNIAFNAQDQRVLFELLTRISRERSFDRQYRKIADMMMQEMEKPSRRFKVKTDDIINVRRYADNPNLQPEDNDQNENQQAEEEDETTDQSMKPQKTRKSSRNKEVRSKETTQVMAKSGLRLDYEKTCFICLKPKCSIFCAGGCQRAFHSLCWKNYLQGDDRMVEALNLKEMGTKFSTWAAQIDHRKMCPQCQGEQKICFCSICGESGILNDDDPESANSSVKCTMKACQRMYHIKCLSESKAFGWLVELANKKIGKQLTWDKLNCPVHYCFGCGDKVSKASFHNLHSCVKCCKTYHPKCLTSASQFMHLHGTYYLCHHHLTPAVRTALEQDYRLVNSDKKDIIELRKAEKDIKSKKNYQITPDAKKEYSYQDFGLTPVLTFTYGDYDELWCRYCGSRFAQGFSDGPWGVQKLCSHHSKLWKKGKLQLSGDQPVEPIVRKETQLRFLNKMVQEKRVQPGKLLDVLIKMRYTKQ